MSNIIIPLLDEETEAQTGEGAWPRPPDAEKQSSEAWLASASPSLTICYLC